MRHRHSSTSLLVAALVSLVACVPMPTQKSDVTTLDEACRAGVPADVGASIARCTERIEFGKLSDADMNDALLFRGYAWILAHDNQKAISDLSAAILVDPQKRQPYFYRGWAYKNASDFDSALVDLEEAARLGTNSADLFAMRGHVLALKKEYVKALSDLNKALSMNLDKETRVFVLKVRGTTWYRLKEYAKSRTDYESAIEAAPDDAELYYDRGTTFAQEKDYPRAIKDFDRSIALRPGFAKAFHDRAIMWSDNKDSDKAIADFDQAILLEPEAAYAFHDRGIARALRGEFDKAIADYDKALEIRPDYARTYVRRGQSWYGKRDFTRAVADFESALRIDPGIKVHRDLAVINFLLGQDEAGAASAQRAWEMYQDTYGLLWLFLSRMRQHDLETARAELGRVHDTLAGSTWPRPLLEFYRGHLTDAMLIDAAHRAELALDEGQSCEADYFVGEFHSLNHDRARAMPYLQSARDHCRPDFFEYVAAGVALAASR